MCIRDRCIDELNEVAGYFPKCSIFIEKEEGFEEYIPVQSPEFLPERTVLCGEYNVFFLEDEFSFSEEIECSLDMSEDIIRAENNGDDVVLLRVNYSEDPFFLEKNCDFIRLAVALRSDDADVLEMALLLFQGRCIVSSLCDIDYDLLTEISQKYGAVVV